MDPREIDGLLNIHLIVDNVSDDAQHGIDDSWTTRASHREPQTTILAQHDCRRHRR